MNSDDPISPTSYVLEITEYNQMVVRYNDTNLTRFKRRCKEMIEDHLNEKINSDASNLTFRTFTY